MTDSGGSMMDHISNMDRHESESLRKLLEITRMLVSVSDLSRMLHMIIEKAAEMMNAERATVFLYDPSTQDLYIKAALEDIEVRFNISKGLAGAAGRDKKTIIIRDAYSDSRFHRDIDQKTGFQTRNLIATPLLDYDGELVGVLEVINRRDGDFNSFDVEILESLAAQAGVVLQRTRLIESQMEKVRIEKELKIAGDIQRHVLPLEPDNVPGYEVKFYFQPAKHIGGDCYDFFPLNKDIWAVLVGDATGHGIAPSLISMETRALLRGVASQQDRLIPCAQTMNDLLTVDLPEDKFITAFLGFLNTASHSIEYISAGQEPLLCYRSATGNIEKFSSTVPPFGILPGLKMNQSNNVLLNPDDLYCIFTDGFTELQNPHGDFLEVEGLIQFLKENGNRPLNDIIEGLIDVMQRFSAGLPPRDDLTAVLIRRKF